MDSTVAAISADKNALGSLKPCWKAKLNPLSACSHKVAPNHGQPVWYKAISLAALWHMFLAPAGPSEGWRTWRIEDERGAGN